MTLSLKQPQESLNALAVTLTELYSPSAQVVAATVKNFHCHFFLLQDINAVLASVSERERQELMLT